MSRNRTITITCGMLVFLVDRRRVLLVFISVGIWQVISCNASRFLMKCIEHKSTNLIYGAGYCDYVKAVDF